MGSEYISNVGPSFQVGDGYRLDFKRVLDGPEEGSVVIDRLNTAGEIVATHIIDPMGWASVLAHTSAAPHDGNTFAVAQGFHAGRIAK